MNDNVLNELFEVINERKAERTEGSYTSYLFDKGIDKILKKCGEECAEMIIAAKNAEKPEIVGEAADLIYHMLVMLAERNVDLQDVLTELDIRSQKQKNLKVFKTVDKNS